MKTLDLRNSKDIKHILKHILTRPSQRLPLAEAQTIIDEVRKNGDRALVELTARFDGIALEGARLRYTREDIARGAESVASDDINVLKAAAQNIREFACRQLELLKDYEAELYKGVVLGQKIVPIANVGTYIPGGRYPLPSSLLMTAIPARIAGVNRLVMCTPPNKNGAIEPILLAAAIIAGIDEAYPIGGAQAIAAMAYGTGSINPVDLIVGPGNPWVTAAKKLVYGDVGIDFLAGPSEVLIIADDSARPSFVAADLLAQAEHDPQAQAILLTTSPALADSVASEVQHSLGQLPNYNARIAKESLERGGLIGLVESIEQAVDIANEYAPEHLELQIQDPDAVVPALYNYGSLFIGPWSAEAFGDYSTGTNHVLPTCGVARYTSGLSVYRFLNVRTFQRLTHGGARLVGPVASRLAEIEGLHAHKDAAEARRGEERGEITHPSRL